MSELIFARDSLREYFLTFKLSLHLELFLAQQTELASKNISLDSIIYNDKNIKTLDKEGFFKISNNNDLVFAKGKYENQKIKSVKQLHPDYIKWINDNEEISIMVKMILNYDN